MIGGDTKSCKKPTTIVQKRVNKFVGENKSKQRDDEDMSSADQPEKPSSQGSDGTGGRKRRSQRLENRRKGAWYFCCMNPEIKTYQNIYV